MAFHSIVKNQAISFLHISNGNCNNVTIKQTSNSASKQCQYIYEILTDIEFISTKQEK